MWRTLARPFLWALGKHGDSRKRRHATLLVAGALVTAGGLLAYALVWPEIPFAEARTTPVSELHPDAVAKIFGRIECLQCTKAIDREENAVGTTGHSWNATYAAFSVRDPGGAIFIDTDAVTRLTPGPSGGDWLDGDRIAVYGTVYDQGNGVLALRAQMMAKTPTDTPAVYAFWILFTTTLGALAIAYVLTDRFLFGSPRA